MSSALDTAGALMQANSDARAGFEDIITISSPALNGQWFILLAAHLSVGDDAGDLSALGRTISVLNEYPPPKGIFAIN
jgi:hypothetical protein